MASECISDRDRILWDWALKQDRRGYEEFGIGIVGIGALYFAFGQVSTPGVKAIIAAVGLIGSIVLFFHIWGSGRQYYAALGILKEHKVAFLDDISIATSWWKEGWLARYFYHPPRRIMLVLMGFVGFSWLVLLAYRVYSFITFGLESSIKSPELRSGFVALYYSMLAVIAVASLILSYKKFVDLRLIVGGRKTIRVYGVVLGITLLTTGCAWLLKPDWKISIPVNGEVLAILAVVILIVALALPYTVRRESGVRVT